jgi:hypothetical protein
MAITAPAGLLGCLLGAIVGTQHNSCRGHCSFKVHCSFKAAAILRDLKIAVFKRNDDQIVIN